MQYPDQGSNLCLLRWEHGNQGSPKFILEEKNRLKKLRRAPEGYRGTTMGQAEVGECLGRKVSRSGLGEARRLVDLG